MDNQVTTSPEFYVDITAETGAVVPHEFDDVEVRLDAVAVRLAQQWFKVETFWLELTSVAPGERSSGVVSTWVGRYRAFPGPSPGR